MADLAVYYEHPLWFEPLFAALDRGGVEYVRLPAVGHAFDPGDRMTPAPVVFNRMAMSSFLRAGEHALFYAPALLDHWRRHGAHVINGADVLAIDMSKARQLSLIAALGLAIPETRVVHRIEDLVAAAASLRFPIVVKANIGGSGAGIVRYETLPELRDAAAERFVPVSVDGVLLVQELVPARDGRVTRIETLDQQFLYAIDIDGAGEFDLCPADACVAGAGKPAIVMTESRPDPATIVAAETIATAAGLDIGGIEVMIDDRDGVPRFYDINALSNFVAKPLDVLGWDPHDRLVDWLRELIAEVTE